MRRRGGLPTLVALLLGLAWALGVPLVRGLDSPFGNWQPDEISHVLTVRWWAAHTRLPPYNLEYGVSVHPPLYHMVGALFWRLGGPLAVRVFSVLLGALTVWMTFRATRALYGRQVGELAAWLVALVPMRASLSGGMSNENLAALAAAAFFAALAEVLRGRRRVGELALWCAVGVGSKLTCLGLFPAVFLALVWRFGRKKATKVTLAILLTSVVAMGWWFLANVSRCGDALCKASADRLWDRIQPGYERFRVELKWGPPRYAFYVASWCWRSFWGSFNGFLEHLPMPLFVSLLFWQTAALWGARRRGRSRARRAWLIAGGIFFLTTSVLVLIFNWRHYSAQGRYFYVILAPFGAITGYGYLALFPPKGRKRAAQGLVAALIALNLWCLWHYLPGS